MGQTLAFSRKSAISTTLALCVLEGGVPHASHKFSDQFIQQPRQRPHRAMVISLGDLPAVDTTRSAAARSCQHSSNLSENPRPVFVPVALPEPPPLCLTCFAHSSRLFTSAAADAFCVETAHQYPELALESLELMLGNGIRHSEKGMSVLFSCSGI